jgi:ABC-2 type transport system ATP-binding protein
MNAIEITNLKKYFGAVKAVNNISLSINEGEIFGFLGPNGAGKTTTIRLILDFIHANSGKIKIFGRDSHYEYDEIKKDLGYIPSEDTLYENWNGLDHFQLFEGIYGKSKNLKKLLDIFDYNPRKRVNELSSGNKKKLAIILALMHEPKILISDEPTNGLDPLLQNRFYETLVAMNKEGMTIFMSSHNLSEVEKICGKFSIIKDGEIITTEKISTLHDKKIFNIDVIFSEKINPLIFKEEGLEIISNNENKFTFQVKKDISGAVKTLSKYHMENIEINHASLEDIFLEFYGVKKNHNNHNN